MQKTLNLLHIAATKSSCMSLTMKSFLSDTSMPHQVCSYMENSTIKKWRAKAAGTTKMHVISKNCQSRKQKPLMGKKLQHNNNNMRRVNAEEVKRADTTDFQLNF